MRRGHYPWRWALPLEVGGCWGPRRLSCRTMGCQGSWWGGGAGGNRNGRRREMPTVSHSRLRPCTLAATTLPVPSPHTCSTLPPSPLHHSHLPHTTSQPSAPFTPAPHCLPALCTAHTCPTLPVPLLPAASQPSAPSHLPRLECKRGREARKQRGTVAA